MKSLCDFCFKPLLCTDEGRYECFYCPCRVVYLYKSAVHLATEFCVEQKLDRKKQIFNAMFARLNWADDVAYLKDGYLTPIFPSFTFAFEVFDKGRRIYQSNDQPYLTPFNVKEKVKIILTFS